MNICALMLVRNEQWVLGLSLDAAARWCDQIIVYDDGSTDRTGEIVKRADIPASCKLHYIHSPREGPWDEMVIRQNMLEQGRLHGGTHFAMIDADEVLTHNLIPKIREYVATLGPRQILDLPMIPVWRGLGAYRKDASVWSHAVVSVAFTDEPFLHWKGEDDGYQHHSRTPKGCRVDRRVPTVAGGVFHLQWANWKRVLAKHVLYRMVDYLRWPEKRTVAQLNHMYDQALSEKHMKTTPVPGSWWGDYRTELADIHDEPWHAKEIERLLDKHGRKAFEGLDLKGY